MKFLFFLTAILFANGLVYGQQLQLHYDLRHTLNPVRNAKNFPTMYFEYFKTIDSGKTLVKPGNFLLKLQADLVGEQANIGKYYMQVSQEVRFWQPKLFINLQYSGGLGITTPRQYSYYIVNTYAIGLSYPFKIGDAYLSSVLNYKYVPYTRPSHDLLFTTYFYKGLLNYKAEIAGSFSCWTENKNHGDDPEINLKDKRFYFFFEPQFWYKVNGGLYIGTKLNAFYHVNTADNIVEVYPTAAVKIKL
ncbi:DUF5020 family protein [Mucilaginibacter gilvus]|nr:DUF5020 family protein [Mucilaginibacter gilvus]